MNIHNQIVYVVIAILALALSNGAVATEVGLKTAKQSPKYATQIVVGNNGSRYDRVLTRTIPIQVQYRAACKSNQKLASAEIKVGRFPIMSSGFMPEESKAKVQSQKLMSSNIRSQIDWTKHMFRLQTSALTQVTNVNPIKACNDFLRRKLSQGMRKVQFMGRDRRIGLTYEISFAAQCRQKWKARGEWSQATRPVQAVIVCSKRRF